MQQRQEPNSFERFRNTTNWVGLGIEALAFSVAVFLRRRFGERYVGVQGVLAIFLIIGAALFFPGYDFGPLYVFLLAYFFMCLRARVEMLRHWREGNGEHSRYNGWPRLMRLFPRLNEMTVKRLIEPPLVIASGVFTMQFNAPLGAYLAVAGGALFVSSQSIEFREHKQALDMNDAVKEAQQRAERFHAMNRRRR